MALPPPTAGCTALVTGASSGIGEQIARELSRRGFHVTLVARRAERLQQIAGELGNALAMPADLTEEPAREQLAGALGELGLTVELLVNNAGFGVYAPFYESSRERELAQLRLLAEAPLELTHRWLPGMVERRRGAVINIASTSAFQALPYNAGYAAAKSYLLMLSEALHAEVAEFGVSVTAVCPGPVRTEFQEVSDAAFAERLPKLMWAPVERVARDAIDAAERGSRCAVPGGPLVNASSIGNRYAPRGVALSIAKRIMSA